MHQDKKYEERCERAAAVSKKLEELFPDAHIALQYRDNWQLLVAVILSAQCTDKKVNEVTARLFNKYPALDDYLRADQAGFEQDIKPTGFYRNKAKNILASARMIYEEHGGRVPDTMEELIRLPGVARKTANIVLGNAFGKIEGIAVDTHVRRFALKLDLTDHKKPDKIEQDLMQLFPRDQWFEITYRLIDYGRNICPARKHDCTGHPLTLLYPHAADQWP
jgi:endonuclease-3